MARVVLTDSIKAPGRLATGFALWIVLAAMASLSLGPALRAPRVSVLRAPEQFTVLGARARYCYAELQLIYRIAIRVDEPERQQQVSEPKPPIRSAAEHGPGGLLQFIVTANQVAAANKDLDRRCATVVRPM